MSSADEPAPRLPRSDRVVAGVLALALTILLERARGHGDWGPSEGVYALTSRLVLEGGDLYGGLVASQPPWVYLFGAGALAVHDSLDWLRFACGLLQVVTGVVAAGAVWRLTGHRVAAILAAGLVVVSPWATHQHGLLLPEQLGSPLLLGAAVLAARPATARWAGVLSAVAVFVKLPFAVPVLLLIAASPGRATALRWAAGALVAQAAVFTVVFGAGFWSQVITAQAQAGGGLELQIGPWVQAAWNLLPLVPFALVAVWQRRATREPTLTRTVAAAATGALITTATIVKPGTGLNVLVPVEPLLVTLAVSGAVWASRKPVRAKAGLAAAALGVLLLAQSASLLLDPTNPRPFHRPASASPGWKVGHTRAEIDGLVRAARGCPAGSVYDGPPLVAFIARRGVPAGQPDFFIVSRARMHANVFARLRADGPRCP